MNAYFINQKSFFYFSTKTYFVGTQKNRLNEMVLLSTQNMLKLMGKKILTFLYSFFLFILTHDDSYMYD